MTDIGLMLLAVIVLAFFLLKKANNTEPSTQDASGYATLTPLQAKKRMDKEKDIIILDVRTPMEYAEGHLPNNILIPFNDLETKASKKLPDKETTIFVYCARGDKSRAASKKLVFLGYTKIFNIGGINEWPYEIIKN